jgi:hypothetical protein
LSCNERDNTKQEGNTNPVNTKKTTDKPSAPNAKSVCKDPVLCTLYKKAKPSAEKSMIKYMIKVAKANTKLTPVKNKGAQFEITVT